LQQSNRAICRRAIDHQMFIIIVGLELHTRQRLPEKRSPVEGWSDDRDQGRLLHRILSVGMALPVYYLVHRRRQWLVRLRTPDDLVQTKVGK
jgi:hypothetical protein